MAKKLAKKRAHSKRYPKQQTMVYRYISVGFAAFLLIFGAKYLVSGTTKVHVLGATTGPILLADKGSDDSSGSSGGGSDSGGSGGSSGGSTSGGSGSGSSGSGGSGSGSGENESGSQVGTVTNSLVSGSTLVDCVGPDGKHFTTEYHDCQELNQKWGRSSFRFTSLNQTATNATSNITPTPDQTRDSHKTLEIETSDHHGKFTVTQAATLKLESQEGHLVVKAKEDNGNEVELNGEDAVDEINKSLESDGVEVSQSGHNTLAIKRASVSAKTVFPLSIDPITHELTVTTPSGVKQVAVLPDQAVNALLERKVMTSVSSQTSSDSAVTTQIATLTELNNQAVFEVQGVSQKRLLGLFPVGFAKTAFVSTETGQVVQLNESALNKFLESLSF